MSDKKENLIPACIAIQPDMKRNLIAISKRLNISISALIRILVNESDLYNLEKTKQ